MTIRPMHQAKPGSMEDVVIARATPNAVTEHDMTGSWRVIVARYAGASRTWYYHTNDDPRFPAVLRRNAHDWLELERGRQADKRRSLRDEISNSGDC